MFNEVGAGALECYAKKSEDVLQTVRSVASRVFGECNEKIIIGVNGSVARREYTSGSDVDYFIVCGAPCRCEAESVIASQGFKDFVERFRVELKSEGVKLPSAGGVFETPTPRCLYLNPIGGEEDLNSTLTKRMLLLLEGEWVFNEDEFRSLRSDLIDKYVSLESQDDKLALFLLNDVVRYWRTICVDFEYKTSGDSNKARGLRLVKLRMSRMLLCFAAILAVDEAVGMSVHEKRKKLLELFDIPALGRVSKILGERFSGAKQKYETFLKKIDDPEVRAALDVVGVELSSSPVYQEMAKLAQDFKDELVEILLERHKDHSQIVRALLL